MEKKNRKGYCIKSDSAYLCNPFWKEREWEFSSAGSEHLPYKQRVGGSNPSTPTSSPEIFGTFFMSKNLRTLLQKSIKNLFRIQNSMFLDFFN